MKELEKTLAYMNNRKYCLLTGNGTTAIYLALKSLKLKNKRIAIPNSTCMNVLLPIYFTNNIPVFIDINQKTLDIDYEQLKKEKVDAIIAVHLYGNICKIKKLERYCQNQKIFLIEDNALAQGIKINKNITGSFGDISILSFGAGKVIDIGHGGAVLTNNKKIYKKLRFFEYSLTKHTVKHQRKITDLGLEYKRIYNIDFGKSLSEHYNNFRQKTLSKKKYFLSKFNKKYKKRLKNELNNLDQLIHNRQSNAKYLYNLFSEKNIPNIELPKFNQNSSFWRFNILVNKNRNELLAYLLSKKLYISSWYSSLDLIFEKRENEVTKNSDIIGNNILNIWTNEQIDENYLNNMVNEIESFLKGKK